MMNKIKIFLFSLALLGSLVAVPVHAQAPSLDYKGLVQCDGAVAKNADGSIAAGEEGRQKQCNFAALINMVNYIIKWIISLSVTIIVVLFAYSGFLYMSGTPENIKKARSILWSAAKGLVIMLVAWFLVYTALTWLTKANSGATSLIQSK